jgi:Zn-finger nucleic acid-binding protein
MNCPVCSAPLRRILYEGFAVFRCMKCHGYLLGENRVEAAKRIRKETVEQLKQQVIDESRPDTKETIRCPRCRRKMEKRFVEAPAALSMDVCPDCTLVWLDGGELARLQLSHEISPAGRDAGERQRRLETMSPEAKAEFEENLSKLKAEESLVASLLREAMIGGGQHWT